MKPELSEQAAHSGGDEIGEVRQGVFVAARVFSNYVLIETPGHPDQRTSRTALHGAALLVFSDQLDKKIQLRTGYAAHVVRDAGLRP